MKVSAPIIVMGLGRSGTTIVHRMLCEHPRVAWLSGLTWRWPNDLRWNRRVMQAIDLPLVGSLVRKRMKPWENYEFWEAHCRGFSRPCRDLYASDVTARARESLLRALSQTFTGKRNRLLIKITGWPRLGYLQEIFPDAKFIHVLRDGRAVANSRVNVEFWPGWGGPPVWEKGELPDEYRAEWLRHGKSFVALAAIEWKLILDAFEHAKPFVKEGNLVTVKYEDFCDAPVDTIRKLIEFADLAWSHSLEQRLKAHRVKNMNTRWERDLTDEQKRMLHKVAGPCLKRYGYV